MKSGLQETQNTDPVLNWRFRLLRAEILLWQGHPQESLDSLGTPPQSISKELLARIKLAEGRALYGLGKSDAAQSRLSEAEQIATAASPDLLGETALAQGTLQFIRHDYSLSEQTLLKALELARQYHQSYLEAKVFGSLSRLFTMTGHYDAAIDWGKKSLDRSVSLQAKHVEAITRLNVGWSYLELGDFEDAVPFFTESDSIAAQEGMTLTQRNDLNSLGRIYFNEGKYIPARDRYEEALKTVQGAHDEPFTAVCMDNLALVAVEQGQIDEARKYNAGALEIKTKVGDRVEVLKSLLTAAIIDEASKEFGESERLLREVINDTKTPITLRWESENELAQLYLKTHQERAAEVEFEKVLNTIDAARSPIHDVPTELAFSARESGFYTNYIRFLADRRGSSKALQIAEHMRARTLEEGLGSRKPVQAQLTEVQRFLNKSGQVVLAYWLAPEKSYLWVITKSQLQLFTLPAKQQIEAKVDRYQQDVTSLQDVEHSSTDGQALYRMLVEPARDMIPAKAQVVVIPDGGLGKLNFETLIVPAPTPHFWINDVQIEDASSLALLIKAHPLRSGPSKLLAIGDPTEVTNEYPRLKYAPEELAAAQANFASDHRKIISGKDAVPSSYAASNPEKFDTIHFATHGFASSRSPLDSAIILSAQGDGSFKLYARDILAIPLKADLVTISACYGAGKRTYSGEGLVGLAWAFLRAGAHQVIAGLWNVEDQSTPELMRTFYTELASGKSATVALRDAKLKMLHSSNVFRLPYYWAAFQLYTGS